MCYELNSSPPIQPIAGAAVTNEDLELVASDGTHLAAFSAIADDPKGPAVVVLPDVRGLFSFYEELSLRFAEIGYDSVAIDYFGRTAGVSKRNEPDFQFMEHVAQTTPEGIATDTRAAVEQLRLLGLLAPPRFVALLMAVEAAAVVSAHLRLRALGAVVPLLKAIRAGNVVAGPGRATIISSLRGSSGVSRRS